MPIISYKVLSKYRCFRSQGYETLIAQRRGDVSRKTRLFPKVVRKHRHLKLRLSYLVTRGQFLGKRGPFSPQVALATIHVCLFSGQSSPSSAKLGVEHPFC